MPKLRLRQAAHDKLPLVLGDARLATIMQHLNARLATMQLLSARLGKCTPWASVCSVFCYGAGEVLSELSMRVDDQNIKQVHV